MVIYVIILPKASKFVSQCVCLAGATIFTFSCKCAIHIQANMFLNLFAHGRKMKRRRRAGCVLRGFRGCRGDRVDKWLYIYRCPFWPKASKFVSQCV